MSCWIKAYLLLEIYSLITITEQLEARSIISSGNSSFPSEAELADLASIASTCLTKQEYVKLSGDRNLTYDRAWVFSIVQFLESVETIGLTELRTSLGFSSLVPWIHYKPIPTPEIKAAAKTIEDYYELMEPQSMYRSLESSFLEEKDMFPVIKFLDERFPSIRSMFKNRLTNMYQNHQGTIDRHFVDNAIHEFRVIQESVDDALRNMHWRLECWF